MVRVRKARALVGAVIAVVIVAAIAVLSTALGAQAVSRPSAVSPQWKTLPGETIVFGPPSGARGPDDLAWLAIHGLDSGRPLIWTEFQNGINPNGTPGSAYGPTQSTLGGFDPSTGVIVRAINLSGHVDGLTSDPATGQLLATTNEDANSAFYVINPMSGAVIAYSYAPSPNLDGNGGTDSSSVIGGEIYVSHSDPEDTTQAAAYEVILHPATLTAQLNPVFYDDSSAIDAATGAMITLALTDPDTNLVMPSESPVYGGDLATISQGDGRIVFATHLGDDPQFTLLNLTDYVSGNLPPIDGLAVATSGEGTLYVVDAKAGTIEALDTSGWATGTVFVTEPNDNGNPLLGTLDRATGVITPLGNHFLSPKGLIFVPKE